MRNTYVSHSDLITEYLEVNPNRVSKDVLEAYNAGDWTVVCLSDNPTFVKEVFKRGVLPARNKVIREALTVSKIVFVLE